MATRQLTDKVNLRSSPEVLAANFKRTMQPGETFDVLSGSANCDTYSWQRVQTSRGEHGWLITGWDEDTKPGTGTPTPATKPVFGFHVMDQGVDFTYLVQLVKADKVNFAVCLEANGLQALHDLGCERLVFRPYLPPSINGSAMDGTRNDIDAAKTWFRQIMAPKLTNIPKWAIIQGPCEQNATNKSKTDGWWYLGLMQCLEDLGYMGVLFNDSIGSWGVQSIDGWDAFQMRYDTGCMVHAKANGHYTGVHLYGPFGLVDGMPNLGSDPNNVGYYRLLAGRIEEAYRTMPEDGRALVLGTECGLAETKYNPLIGAPGIVADLHGFQKRAQSFPYLVGVAFWTMGHWSDEPKSQIDSFMKDIAAAL